MKTALSVIALIVLALALPLLFSSPEPLPQENQLTDLPWQVTVDERGDSTVFGLTPGISTLADVRQHFGNDMEVAIVAMPDEIGSLEGYYSQVKAGFILGRLIVTLDLTPEAITEIRERALKAKHMESTTRKITLHPDDLAAAEKTPIRAITLIPSANLDEDIIIQRFGQPAERIVASETLTHLLYPNLGLDVVLDTKGKEVLQYVSPRHFEQVRTPLLKAETPGS